MANPFLGKPTTLSGMVYDMLPVVPNNSTDNVGEDNVAIGLYIEAGGSVSIHNIDGNVRTFNVPDNFYLVCSVGRVLSSGTTATGIHALVV